MRKICLLMALSCMAVMGAKAEKNPYEGEIATWSGFRKGAASFTFDDGAPSHIADAAPLFEQYGYRATFYLVTNWNPDWSGFQDMADKGHEIGSHSKTHGQNMSGEEASSKGIIQSNIQQKYGCTSVAYPNCNVPNTEAVLQNYIAGRICNGSWAGMADIMGKDGPSDWCKVPALMTGANGTISNTNDFTSKLQNAINSGGWVVFLTFGFIGKNNGNATYSPTDITAIAGALKWANENDDDIWVAPLRDVVMYCKERKAASFNVKSHSDESVVYELTHSIADNISEYDYPLSLRVLMPEGWADVKITQAEATLSYTIDAGWVYFDAVPNGGDIILQNASLLALEQTNQDSNANCSKLFRDDHIFILRGDKTYTLQGQEVK